MELSVREARGSGWGCASPPLPRMSVLPVACPFVRIRWAIATHTHTLTHIDGHVGYVGHRVYALVCTHMSGLYPMFLMSDMSHMPGMSRMSVLPRYGGYVRVTVPASQLPRYRGSVHGWGVCTVAPG